MKRPLRTLLVALFLATGSAALPAPAQAEGAGDPRIVSPTHGASVASGYSGPVTVDLSDAPTGAYELTLVCNDWDYYEVETLQYDGVQDSFTWYPPQVAGPAACELRVDGDYSTGSASAYSSFTVKAPPLPAMVIDRVSAAPSPFYPLVRDGFRDTTTMTYRLNQRADVRVTVRNGNGSRVRTATPGWQGAGARSWRWDGRNNSGRLLPTGRYSIQVVAINPDGKRATVSRAVAITTDTVQRRVTKSRTGDEGRPSASSSCYVTRDTYTETMELDCWGGSYAKATYSFAIPASATNVSWTLSGGLAGSDICCDGVISRSGSRTAAKMFVVTAKVTGWRAYEVRLARVTYTVTVLR